MADERAPAGGEDEADEATKAFEALLPFNVDSHVAAAVMGKSRWEAGAAIMQASDPGRWKTLSLDAQLGADNAETLSRCQQVASKSGQTQRCVVKVTPAHY